ncbi:isochorismatase hydrolase [Punctularia strigosozonata HHB-11173 SS5]|uniref:isochorismatase hydrolase n=1 Tax=Punctularia strigosozonata (strain HHB-11173) TaxID=741275 RepID=UPI00044164CB|nr:isochorismatase hydrolase [Punctularia strigosozonata HHB-11173 SS5]EIN05595.1 isochorismatase hydrolase [Punctularia strigosozonata HHB-11173 SS5]
MKVTSNTDPIFIGTVVLLVVDIQGGSVSKPDNPRELPHMPGKEERAERTKSLLARCREAGVSCVFVQEVHKPSLVDIGRELDGTEDPHCIEGWPETELADWLQPRADEYVIRKRRYSCFFGTELDIVLRGYKADTVLLVGGLTDVCIHYTAVDAHQRDYYFRTITDCVAGSTKRAHDNALEAMKYMQRDALVTCEAVLQWLDRKRTVVQA